MTETVTPAARPARVNKAALVVGALIVLPLVGVLVANIGRDPHMVRSPLIGRMAPPFSLSPVGGGKTLTLDSFRGKPLVVNFWATWCVPCLEEHEALAGAARALKDVQFVGVVYEDEESRAAEFLKKSTPPYPSLADPDGRAAIAYGVFGVPETFFIDAEGRIIDKYVGPLRRDTIMELVARTRKGAP